MKTTQVGTLAALVGVAFTIAGRPAQAVVLPTLQRNTGVVPVPIVAAPRDALAIYNDIKALETSFPLPQPRAEVNMGTFDVSTKQFIGLSSQLDDDVQTPTGKPVILPPISVSVNAVAVSLRFAAQNGSVTYTVTPTNGRSGPGPTRRLDVASGQSRTVDVGRATSVRWVARAGTAIHRDEVVFKRPKIVGAGAFIVPVLPVVVVYEPPPAGGGPSTQTYTEEHSVGTTVTMELTQENTTTTPGSPSQFGTTGDLSSKASTLAEVFETIGGVSKDGAVKTASGRIAAGLKGVAKLLGSATANVTSGDIRSQVSEKQLTLTLKSVVPTGSNLGPGKGDRIYALTNARLVWLVEDGDLTLALLGFDGTRNHPVQDLLVNPAQTGLDAATIQELLKLDPFVAGGPNVALAEPRFSFVMEKEISNGSETFSASQESSQTDKISTTSFQSRTEDFRKGWLSFLGVGVDVTKQVTSKITQSNTTAVSVKSTTTAEVTLNVVGDAHFDVLFDHVFGTFAIRNHVK